MNNVNLQLLPAGPALPPSASMKFKTKFLGITKLRIINERPDGASISIDGSGFYVPGINDDSQGILDISGLAYFGRILTITNQCGWVLKIDFQ